MKHFAQLLVTLPIAFCLTFPSASSLTTTLNACSTDRRACVKTLGVTNGPDVGTYDLFFSQTYATFNLDNFINAYAPTATPCD